jgi:hypothetical protein
MQKLAWQRYVCGFKSKPYGTISRGSMTERNRKYIEDLRLRKPHVSLGRGRPYLTQQKPQKVDQHFHRLQFAIGFRIKYKK